MINGQRLHRLHARTGDRQFGFTLLEVLVALVIIATALGAGMRAIASLTGNSADLRELTLAGWAAENRLAELSIEGVWPAVGQRRFACPQEENLFTCEERVNQTPNAAFRTVDVRVFGERQPQRALAHLSRVIANGQ